MLCEYGCGQEAKYKLSSGKWCCNQSYKKCPEILRKNREGQQKVKIMRECPHCHKLFTDGIGGQYKKHIEKCIYNIEKKNIFKALGNITEDIQRWQNWYNRIIEKRKTNPILEGYRERHHIIPKSLGGNNNKENLIYLTAKEHYICHLLLVRICQNNKIAYKKMLCALFKLGNCNKHYNSNTYKIYREEYIKNCCIGHHNQDGEKNSAWGKKWMSNNKLQISKMIKPELINQYLKDGWVFGNHTWIKLEKQNKKQEKKNLILQERIQLYTEYYKIYNKFGWNKFKEITNYKYTKANLVQNFKKLVKEFIPQNGKIRGKIQNTGA